MTDAPPAGSDRVARLREALDRHRPADHREEASCAAMAAALDRLAHPFDQDADPTHVTASAIVVGPRGVVLHLHRRLHRWLQPGGHVEADEWPEDAAVRESWEETGLEVAHPPGGPVLVHVDVHDAAKGHTHLDLRYLVVAPDRAPAPPPGESQQVAWFTWEDAGAMADEGLSTALRTARSIVRTSA